MASNTIVSRDSSAWSIANILGCRMAATFSLLAALALVACSDSTSPQTPGCTTFQTIAVGATELGTLTNSDCRLPADNSFYDHWRLTVNATTSLHIDMMSDDFDTFLILNSNEGIQIAFVDDGGEGNNSRLELTLNAGVYQIFANSLEPGSTGAYSLSVTPQLQ
jgi:hypothetical protein